MVDRKIIKELFGKSADDILKYKDRNGNTFFTKKRSNLLFEIYSVYSSIKDPDQWLSRYLYNHRDSDNMEEDLFFHLPSLGKLKQLEVDKLHIQTKGDKFRESIYKCFNCGSNFVDYTEVQTRSCDEGASVKLKCRACNKNFFQK
mgnify:CR=1 FL=1